MLESQEAGFIRIGNRARAARARRQGPRARAASSRSKREQPRRGRGSRSSSSRATCASRPTSSARSRASSSSSTRRPSPRCRARSSIRCPDHDAGATTTRKLSSCRPVGSGVRRVVYAASSSAYGDTPTLPKIETMKTSPLSPYAVSKLAGEMYCQVFATAYGLQASGAAALTSTCSARTGSDIRYRGRRPRASSRAALAGKGVTIYGDSTQSARLLLHRATPSRRTCSRPAPARQGRRAASSGTSRAAPRRLARRGRGVARRDPPGPQDRRPV